jgi:hypothetical protein
VIGKVNAPFDNQGIATMGVKIFKISGERQALEFTCDSPAHGDEMRTAWFDCGSYSGNLCLANATGWTELHENTGAWFCPQCVHRVPMNVWSRERADVDARLPNSSG